MFLFRTIIINLPSRAGLTSYYVKTIAVICDNCSAILKYEKVLVPEYGVGS